MTRRRLAAGCIRNEPPWFERLGSKRDQNPAANRRQILENFKLPRVFAFVAIVSLAMTDVLTFPKAMLSIFPYRAKDIWLEGLIKDRFKDLSQRGKVAVGTSGALEKGRSYPSGIYA